MRVRHYLEFKSYDKITLSGYYAWTLLGLLSIFVLYAVWNILKGLFNIISTFF